MTSGRLPPAVASRISLELLESCCLRLGAFFHRLMASQPPSQVWRTLSSAFHVLPPPWDTPARDVRGPNRSARAAPPQKTASHTPVESVTQCAASVSEWNGWRFIQGEWPVGMPKRVEWKERRRPSGGGKRPVSAGLVCLLPPPAPLLSPSTRGTADLSSVSGAPSPHVPNVNLTSCDPYAVCGPRASAASSPRLLPEELSR
ncbi:hypothetical protein EJ06DRAFT_384802 [Trichodelitschia bisporula]|uniref:Uncharacterized protein n=1 Tax=Trichodelitschia bisporula TaxID=703511 RepID=A0A6G1HZM9_9PEZI|nr:hypothetical protein EJ06DRAFT_384802 [Trichodelitschia bisporula]